MYRPRLFAAVGVIALGLLMLAGCATAPEYESSNQPRRTWPNVSQYGGVWVPNPGYKWTSDDKDDLSVYWTAGQGYYVNHQLIWPHIASAQQEGTWEPDPGYYWTHVENRQLIDYAVAWTPGFEYRLHGQVTFPHIYAGKEEGVWYAGPGYRWAHRDESGRPIAGDLTVEWAPGSGWWQFGERKWPHVVAADKEGYWQPESGFEFLHPGSAQMDVIATDDPHSPSSKREAMKRHWVEYLQEIQAADDYANWSGPPADLFAQQTEP
jgi:hypothetical protein